MLDPPTLPPYSLPIALALFLLYPFTLTPTPHTPQFSLDYLLHTLTTLLFPSLNVIYSLCTGYILTLLATNRTYTSSLTTCVLVSLFYTVLYSLGYLNKLLGQGRRRIVDWDNEVAVVTGGSGGLGWLVAQLLNKKGASVAVWDVKAPEEWDAEAEGLKWYKVDVGDKEQVQDAWQRVKEDLGTPTVLINNAGIVNGLPILALSTEQIQRSLTINLLSHFHTVQTFLPSMLASTYGGTIVTVASVLGHLGASHLTDYTATKAALLAFHTSLRAEIAAMSAVPQRYPGAKNTKTVLVKPGQLSTKMFETLETPSEFFGPVVAARDLAMEIVRAVEGGRNTVIAMPVYARLVEWMGVLPSSLQRAARWVSGVDGAMETFGASSSKK